MSHRESQGKCGGVAAGGWEKGMGETGEGRVLMSWQLVHIAMIGWEAILWAQLQGSQRMPEQSASSEPSNTESGGELCPISVEVRRVYGRDGSTRGSNC